MDKSYKIIVHAVIALLTVSITYFVLKNNVFYAKDPMADEMSEAAHIYISGVAPYMIALCLVLAAIIFSVVMKYLFQEIKLVDYLVFYGLVHAVMIFGGAVMVGPISLLYSPLMGLLFSNYLIAYTALYFATSYAIYKFIKKDDKNPAMKFIVLLLSVLISYGIISSHILDNAHIEKEHNGGLENTIKSN